MLTAVDGKVRNYSYNYDKDMFSSLWVAYPLYQSVLGGTRDDSWAADPNVPREEQINVWSSSYGVNVGSTSNTGYDSSVNFYARGHQIPDADRSGNTTMQAQTYYSTNMTPQIQNGFNGGIWATLEAAVRGQIPAGDTLYVVTGAAFGRNGEDVPVKKILNKNDSKMLPVPNYYWKALLKVVRSGDKVTEAKTIGFWLPHDDLNGCAYDDYVVSVDQIEQWTGLDLFPNLPDSIESQAESFTSWATF